MSHAEKVMCDDLMNSCDIPTMTQAQPWTIFLSYERLYQGEKNHIRTAI
jgi:hypothetical protein